MSRVVSRTRSTLAVLVSTQALLLSACGSDTPEGNPGDVAAGETGSVGLALDAAGDIHLATVSYDITGNGFHKAGTLDVSHSKTISGVIGGIPAGNGYAITLIAVDTKNSAKVCAGSATFSIVARQTSTAKVRLDCTSPSGNGSVSVTGSTNVCPRIDALSVSPAEVTVGSSLALSATVADPDQAPAAATLTWQADGGAVTNATAADASFKCTATGTFTVTLSVTDTACTDSASASVVCTAAPPPTVVFNEVESNGGTPGDWAELYNFGTSPVDLSGFVFKDNDDSHNYVLPSGSVIAPGGYLTLEEAAFGFGLGGADSVRLFGPGGSPVIDSYSWTAHATITYGRCPNGSGAFASTASSTKNGPNDCGGASGAGGTGGASGSGGTGGMSGGGAGGMSVGGAGGIGGASGGAGGVGGAGGNAVAETWPGANDVTTVDGANVFGTNLSGLTYEVTSGGDVLWAVKNGPGTLYRLVFSGGIWTPDPNNGWGGAGKPLRYIDGTGDPDSEGVTRAELDTPFAYIATERNNANNGVSRPSVLRVDTTAAGSTISADHEWALVSDLPTVGANLGLEAITWLPDTFLTAHGFIDESTGQAYAPANYANHGSGIFFVGLEANGVIYAYALDHSSSAFHRVATIPSGQAGIMSLEFDRETGSLWAGCDDSCNGQTNVLVLDQKSGSPTLGHFGVKHRLARPSTMPNINNEGFALVPEALCSSGQKAAFWSDDNGTDGHSIRRDTVPCGAF